MKFNFLLEKIIHECGVIKVNRLCKTEYMANKHGLNYAKIYGLSGKPFVIIVKFLN